MSLPAGSSSRAAPEGPEFWTDPCGIPVEANDPPDSDVEIATRLTLELEIALNYLGWKEKYVSGFLQRIFYCTI